ncbi:uncharacterized protein [Amphiura filiformis]|uniref:uncharacterized protein n=1 Tax=Amphiura filiformis TaxID=82378 RepID=UPI003B20EC47
MLPTLFMTNARSLVNKLDEASVIFELNNVDIAVVSESWFKSTIPDHQVDLGGYTLFSKSREHKRGGGVAIYVRQDIPTSYIADIVVPVQLECTWVLMRPKRLPRGISAIAVCAVYITTDSPHQELLSDHLLQSVDFLRSKYPEIGSSDHKGVLWNPKVISNRNNSVKIHVGRPITEDGINRFGTWIQKQDWHEILECEGSQSKVDQFYAMLDSASEECFPIKKKKIHNNDKPWITPYVKKLIKKRQMAFEVNPVEWRKLRNKVQREITKAKLTYHAQRIRSLQKTEPRKWHQQIKIVTNNNKSELRVSVPGVADDDSTGKANTINNMFASVSAHIEPLVLAKLPAYLPAKNPVPHLYPWDVYSELKKVNPSKAGGPDGFKPQLVREFAYELSIPLTDILNSSYKEGIVPTQWKKAIIVPVPKTSPPNVEKLRPVSLTSIFSKIAEGFIYAKSQYWKYVDDMTFGENRHRNVKGCLQDDLNDFTEWAKNNCLKLNPSKCQALLVNFGRSEPLHTDLRIGI